jgi:hypothetical protein
MAQQQIRQERQQDLTRLETLMQSQFKALPERFSLEVERLFPLELQGIEGNLQLRTSAMPTVLSRFLEQLGGFTMKNLPSRKELTMMRQEISSAVNSLQPMQRQAFADSIELADASLKALELLSSPITEEDLLLGFILAGTVSDTLPTDAPNSLRLAVESRKDSLMQLANARIQSVLKQQEHTDLPALRSIGLVAGWLIEADQLEDSAPAATLLRRLEMAEWTEQRKQLTRKQFESDQAFEVAQLRLLGEGSAIMEETMTQRQALSGAFKAAYDELAKDIAANHRMLQEKQRAGYQLWALSQIQAADEMIGKKGSENIGKWLNEAKADPKNAHLTLIQVLKDQRAKNFTTELITTVREDKNFAERVLDQDAQDRENAAGDALPFSFFMRANPGLDLPDVPRDITVSTIVSILNQPIGWKNQSELTKALTADAMLHHLMEIDEAFLDRPVAALYNEAFQAAWTFLEDSPYRLEVAKLGIEIPKKAPGDNYK